MMDTKAKMQRVLDVIDGRAHPSTLVEILPPPGVAEENVLRLAVNFLVAREREKMGGDAHNRFRLRVVRTKEIHEGDEVRQEQEVLHETGWIPERSQFSVPSETGRLRLTYPVEAIMVERSYEH